MSAPPEILELVERFKSHKNTYLSGHYNETQVRRDFIDAFFTLLDWALITGRDTQKHIETLSTRTLSR